MLHIRKNNPATRRLTLRGSVLENCQRRTHDAACYLLLEADQRQFNVIYHSEFPPTANFYGADIGFELRCGDYVEIFAEVLDSQTLTICNATDYYIRRLSS
jgi:hypothetical protein